MSRPSGLSSYAKKCLNVLSPPQLPDPTPENLGLRVLNADELRCYLLTQKLKEVGGNRSVLDIDNWFDCQIAYPPNPEEIINKALADLGYLDIVGGSKGAFFNELAADLEDSQHAKSAGPLIALLSAVANLPRQDSLDRALFTEMRRAAISTLDEVGNFIKKQYPGTASDATQSGIKIVKNVVDIAIATAEYLVEYKAIRGMAASRIYSTDRYDFVQNAYRKQYALPAGTFAASSTVAAWCRASNTKAITQNNPLAYLSAPDGTDGEAVAKQLEYEAAKRLTDEAAKKLSAHFGNRWQQFFGLSGMLGAWVLSYDRDDVHPNAFEKGTSEAVRGFPGYGSNALLRYIGVAAVENKDSYPLWRERGETGMLRNLPQAVLFDSDHVGMAMPALAGKPKLAEVWWHHSARPAPGVIFPDAKKLLLASAAFMWAAYPPKLKSVDWMGNKRSEIVSSPKLTDGFAADMWVVWKFWESYVNNSVPFKGRFGKWQFLQAFFKDRVASLFGALDRPALGKVDWSMRAYFAMRGTTDLSPPKVAQGRPSPCPVPGDTSCLPCDVIRDRLPIGARQIAIPMLIEYSGSSARGSSEFRDWAKVLAGNGYPGYYIDCIARDVTFKSKSTGKSAKGLAGAEGLTAPMMAKIDALMTIPPPVPELEGITRPLTLEPYTGKKP